MSFLTVILLLSLVIFITHSLEAVTGFGCTVLAFPFVIAITGDIGYSKIILSILGWLLAIYFAAVNYRRINWRQFAIIASLAALGLPLGILIFKNLDGDMLKRILGGFIVLSAGIQLYKLYNVRERKAARFNPLNYLYLFFGGIVHGAFATGGPLIVLYSAKKITNKGEFRATMCLLWSVLNTFLMIQYITDGALTPEIGITTAALIPSMVLSIVVGEKIHKKVNEELFKKIVFWLLLVVGVVMLLI